MESGLPTLLVATVVVVLCFISTVVRASTSWWERLAALAGLAFAAWFWFTEFQRAAHWRGKGR